MLTRLLIAVAVLPAVAFAQGTPSKRVVPVENGAGLEFVQVVPQTVTYKGQTALRLVEGTNQRNAVALVNDVTFQDGRIEIDLAGSPSDGSAQTARGFVGIVFRSTPHAAVYDCFYIRPTNGRADDQLRRNHSTQYVSEPAFGWQKLRTEAPGVYESYVDLETGAWTHLAVDVSGVGARLFVNGAAQPALIVKDLKRGVTSGQIGLWIGPGTEAHFRNLQITSR